MNRIFLILVALLVLLAGAIAWYASGVRAAGKAVEEVWREEIFQGREPLDRFPRRETNASAQRLEAIGTTMGINFRTPQERDRPVPDPEGVERIAGFKQPLKDWREAANQATDNRLLLLPEPFLQYLDWAESNLASAETVLAQEDPPTWALDISLGTEMPIPNLLGQLELHHFLSLRALRLLQAGAVVEADRSLEAAATMRLAAESSPAIISQLIAISQANMEQLVLRRFCSPAERWQRRVESVDYTSMALTSMQLDAWAVGQGLEVSGEGAPGGVWTKLGLAHYAEAMQHAVERLRLEDPTTFDSRSFHEEELARIPRWNIMARVIFPDVSDVWHKAARAELGSELTAAILRLRRGERLDSMTRLDSTTVPGAYWSLEETPGAVRFRFQNQVPEVPGAFLALDYSLLAGDCERN